MIAFVDIESTGLDMKECSLLEVGILLVNDDLSHIPDKDKPYTCFSCVIKPLFSLTPIDPVVLKMHTHNGLFEECEKEGYRRYEADELLFNWLSKYTQGSLVTIAGNSVHWDLQWLREHLSKFASLFDRRVIDNSTINQLAKRWSPKLYNKRPRPTDNHRALDDCFSSHEELFYYKLNGLFN